MSDAATKSDIERLEKQLEERFADMMQLMQTFMHQVDNRFNKVESDIAQLNGKYDHLIQTLDTFIGRIDGYETEMAARDKQFERLLAWARKVSEKTGIPLENL